MAINPHHTIDEIQGTRCSIVEKKITSDRAQFLKEILELNGLKVLIKEEEDKTFTIGVTDLIFNPIHAIYSRKLRIGNKVVTPAYWYQQEQKEGFYWDYKKQN